jgi:hypothetical protein
MLPRVVLIGSEQDGIVKASTSQVNRLHCNPRLGNGLMPVRCLCLNGRERATIANHFPRPSILFRINDMKARRTRGRQ